MAWGGGGTGGEGVRAGGVGAGGVVCGGVGTGMIIVGAAGGIAEVGGDSVMKVPAALQAL